MRKVKIEAWSVWGRVKVEKS